METNVAKLLLDTQAVKLSLDQPFTWSSGWKSPIYCDNRTLLSFPAERTAVTQALAQMINKRFSGLTAIVGVATAGIAIGALVAQELGLPYAYCRPKPKEHGLKKQLEGRLDPSAKVVVIEDLISTGGSSLKVVEFLRKNEYQVMGLAAIFSYAFDQARFNFKEANCEYCVLSDYNDLIQIAKDNNYVNSADQQTLKDWRNAPEKWGT